MHDNRTMKTYKCRTDRRTRWLTVLYIAVIAVLAVVVALLYEGGYLSAWFVSFVLALVALTVLSIPRRLTVAETCFSIRCVLDITEIPYDEMVAVRPVGGKEMRWMLPIFGVKGFFGYFGHFLNFNGMRHVEIYASTWSDFVEITTVYEKTYIVSCPQRDELVALLLEKSVRRDTPAEE